MHGDAELMLPLFCFNVFFLSVASCYSVRFGSVMWRLLPFRLPFGRMVSVKMLVFSLARLFERARGARVCVCFREYFVYFNVVVVITGYRAGTAVLPSHPVRLSSSCFLYGGYDRHLRRCSMLRTVFSVCWIVGETRSFHFDSAIEIVVGRAHNRTTCGNWLVVRQFAHIESFISFASHDCVWACGALAIRLAQTLD